MKNIFFKLIAIIAIGFLFSCEPVEDRSSLPAITKTAATLNFTVTPDASNKNKIVMTNLDTDIIPYWSFTDKDGNELGHFNTNVASVTLPFAGVYYVKYTGYTRGGAVEADPVKVTIAQNDSSYFSDPRWALLTNGVVGKTWIIKIVAPIEFVGTNIHSSAMDAVYGKATGTGDWSWYPTLSSISWAGYEDKDWGEITFDLKGGYNVTVKQTSVTTGSTVKTTKTGTYTYSQTSGFTNDRIVFNGNLEMLHMNGTYSDAFSFSNVRLYELTATTLSYASIRNDGQVLIYHLIVKPTN